jgi:thermitase
MRATFIGERSLRARFLLTSLLIVTATVAWMVGTPTLHAAPPAPADGATAERTGAGAPSSLPTTRTADGREAVAGRVIVGFQPGVTDAEKATVNRTVAGTASANAASVTRVGDTAQTVDAVGAPSLDGLIASYRADPRVRYAEPDYVVHALDLPNDPLFGEQYGMAQIQAPAAWGVTHGAGAVKIAILDCGIHEAHPDLAGKVVARRDFTASANGTDDLCNHGTHVAGIASADTNNGTGVAGIGYNTLLLNGKILSDGGVGYDSQIADGIRWAADNGANVINMSLGGTGACSQTFQDAINYAWSKNVVVVAAAGNSGGTGLFQPADCAHVVAVASTDVTDAKSGFSNYGSWVHVAAPGSAIYSTVNPDLNGGAQYAYFSGTSMASPHVAGLAALIWSTSWGTSAQAVVQRIESTADHIPGTGTDWQYGRIDALAAVGADTSPPTATSLSPSTAVVGGAPYTLTIMGTNFRSGATVLWNGAPRPALSVTSTQLTTLVATADLSLAGTVNIAVANADGTVSPPLALTIIPSPPRPVTIGPANGPASGGTTSTITGTAFQSGATVAFDGVAGTVLSVTGTQIVVTAPAHTAGDVDVVITNPDGQIGTMPHGFVYYDAPTTRVGPSVPAVPVANPAPRPAPPPPTTSGSNTPAPAPAPAPPSR